MGSDDSHFNVSLIVRDKAARQCPQTQFLKRKESRSGFEPRSLCGVIIALLHGWYHMKLLPSRRVMCTPCNHALCHFMQSHIGKVHACLTVTCHLHFWQNDQDLLRATTVARGWNEYRNELAQKADTGEQISPTAPAGIRTRNHSITSPVL